MTAKASLPQSGRLCWPFVGPSLYVLSGQCRTIVGVTLASCWLMVGRPSALRWRTVGSSYVGKTMAQRLNFGWQNGGLSLVRCHHNSVCQRLLTVVNLTKSREGSSEGHHYHRQTTELIDWCLTSPFSTIVGYIRDKGLGWRLLSSQ